MKVENEVVIYVESFVDALEIVDKMNISLPHAIIFMDENEFFEGKCHVVIDKTMFMFLPVYKLSKKEEENDDWDKVNNYISNIHYWMDVDSNCNKSFYHPSIMETIKSIEQICKKHRRPDS